MILSSIYRISTLDTYLKTSATTSYVHIIKKNTPIYFNSFLEAYFFCNVKYKQGIQITNQSLISIPKKIFYSHLDQIQIKFRIKYINTLKVYTKFHI